MNLKLPLISKNTQKQVTNRDFISLLSGMKFGLEKEGLRVNPSDGRLAQTPHRRALGSALTHPNITTDYSEALLEFVTGTHTTAAEALVELELHQAFAANVLDDERIWPLSMPCLLPDSDADIPLAYYGESHIGRLKTVYRRGLGFRYGRQMQTIAGVHFNVSFPDDFWFWQGKIQGSQKIPNLRLVRDIGYFNTIRNFRRLQWLYILLTGASPAVDESFRLLATDRFLMQGRTNIAQGATSLRMSDLGYQSTAQESINISFNRLDTYCSSLESAVTQPWPTYEGVGLVDEYGFKQLNTAVLQIENEYYSSIRPKRGQNPGERPVRALLNRGVEYLEIRAIDLNPFTPNGISENETALITLLIVASALADSPVNTDAECAALNSLNARATWAGRRDNQKYCRNMTFRSAGLRFLNDLDFLAECLDQAFDSTKHLEALTDARCQLSGTKSLLSYEIEQKSFKSGHLAFGLDMAENHHQKLLSRFANAGNQDGMKKLAADSLVTEEVLSEANEGSFENFVRTFVNQV